MTASTGPAAGVRLRLFGPPALVLAGEERLFAPTRPFQLLAFLAVRRAWVSRDEIAELLWPGRGTSVALGNLRTALARAHRIPGAETLEQQADRLRWPVPSDLGELEQAAAEQRDGDIAACAPAPLLQGLEPGLPPAAAAWLAFERARVAAAWRASAARRLQALADSPEAAARLAETMLASDPGDDQAALALAQALQALGRTQDARRALEHHVARLAREFDVEPGAAVREALSRLGAAVETRVPGRSDAPAPSAAGTASMPAGFVGRRLELAQLEAHLMGSALRLLTLVGEGGAGKSSLARAALGALAPRFECSAWVALASTGATVQVPARIGEALREPLTGAGDPWSLLQARIGVRRCLLVLDNAEQLLERDGEGAAADGLVAALEALLAACPGLRLMVTSRERLQAPSESALRVSGLPLPDLEETDAEVLRHNDAVRLFEARARAADAGFVLHRHAATLVRLLHALEGLPLAIELAAAWVRLLPPGEIVAGLASSLQLLEAPPGRGRGLNSSFEQSWQRLGTQQQTALTRLALLPGPFRREMAEQVALAALPLLGALADKSLLRADGDGRFSLHPLLQRWVAERAAPAERAALQARHAAYAGLWLAPYTHVEKLQGQPAFDAITFEMPHLRAAWAWALEHEGFALCERFARVLTEFFLRRGLIEDGLKALQAAVAPLRSTGRYATRACAATLRALGVLQYHDGQYAAAVASAREAAALARRVGDTTMVRGCLTVIANGLLADGRHADARPYFEQARRLSLACGDTAFAAVAGMGLGLVEYMLGRLDAALARLHESAAIHRERGSASGLVSCLNNIGKVHEVAGQDAQALAAFEEALQLAVPAGLVSIQPILLLNAGVARLGLGQLDRSRALAEQALALQHHGEVAELRTELLLLFAQLEAACARPDAMQAALAGAVSAARARESRPLLLRCLAAYGQALALLGRPGEAAAAWRWALAQPGLEATDSIVARRRLQGLGALASLSSADAAAQPASLADWLERMAGGA